MKELSALVCYSARKILAYLLHPGAIKETPQNGMKRRSQKPISPKVMNELSKFVKNEEEDNYAENNQNDELIFTTDVVDSQNSALVRMDTSKYLDIHTETMSTQDFIANPMLEIDLELPLSQIFMTDEKGHQHRLTFSAVFRKMKPIFLNWRDFTDFTDGDTETQTTGRFVYKRMRVPRVGLHRLVFRKKYRICDEERKIQEVKTKDMEEKMKKLRFQLLKQKKLLKKTTSAIYMKMNGMIVRFTTASLVTIEQAVISKKHMSKYYEGNYAHLLSINNNNDIVLVIIEIVNPVIEPVRPIRNTAMNTYDKMIHIHYNCSMTKKKELCSIPYTTFFYKNPTKKSFPMNCINNPPKWLKAMRWKRVNNFKKIRRESLIQQCSAVNTSWFALQIESLRVRAQSRVFEMVIMFRRENYEQWIMKLQSSKNTDDRTRRVTTACGTCKTFELMVRLKLSQFSMSYL